MPELSKIADLSPESEQTILGVCSEIPWQHLIGSFPDHPHHNYINLDQGFQIVVYTRVPLNHGPGTVLRLHGRAVEVQGKSKRPGSDEVYRETQFLADTIESIGDV